MIRSLPPKRKSTATHRAHASIHLASRRSGSARLLRSTRGPVLLAQRGRCGTHRRLGSLLNANPVEQKFRCVCKPIFGTTADHNVNNSLKSSRHLLYKSKDRNKYSHRITCTLFPVSWKYTEKQLQIIRDISIPNHLPHHGLSHKIEL